jgi:Helix-turn-helix domain
VGERQGDATPHPTRQTRETRSSGGGATRAPLSVVERDMLTVSAAAAISGITEKTIRKALKDGRLACTVDTSPGPWPKQGRYLIRRADVDAFKTNGYDPCFRKGRFAGKRLEQTARGNEIVAFSDSVPAAGE